MRVLITGATGLIGKKLISLFQANSIGVHYLTTSAAKTSALPYGHGFFWDPEKGVIDEAALIGVDAIIHLAGASIAKRWTDTYRQEIIESRTFSADLLYKVLRKNPHQVTQIVSASAIGIYADSLTELHHEDSPHIDTGFLGSVVEKWEAGVDRFSRLEIKVCKLRTGIVLSAEGGALPEMAKPVVMGIGAALGTGKQLQSWIHIDDLAAMYLFAINNGLEGIYNAVAPNPVTNAQLTQSIARAGGKKIWLPNIPKFVLKLILGKMHILLFSSQAVSSGKISRAGFRFMYTDVGEAIEELLKNKKAP